MISLLLKLNTLPFRLLCQSFHPSSTIGPSYSFIQCHLKNIVVGSNVHIGSFAWLQTVPRPKQPTPSLTIKSGAHIGRRATISAAKKIVIGKNCLLSFDVSIIDHQHQFKNPLTSPLKQGITNPKTIIINNDCFIGARAFIMPGVTLGQHCVVGANSVVTKSFPDYSVIAGSPAKLIRRLKT